MKIMCTTTNRFAVRCKKQINSIKAYFMSEKGKMVAIADGVGGGTTTTAAAAVGESINVDVGIVMLPPLQPPPPQQQQQQQQEQHHQQQQRGINMDVGITIGCCSTSRSPLMQVKHVSAAAFTALLFLIFFVDSTTANWWQLGTYTVQSIGLLDASGSLQSHAEICQSFKELTNEQKRICLRSQRIMTAISQGARIAKEECQHQFRHSRWNCTTPPDTPSVYGNIMTIKSRETAYIHAINSASLAWSVTRACSRGELTECSCDNSIRRKQRKWQWGGCSEDVNYGVMFSRRFTDSQESNQTAAGLMNLHNNEAGRRALRSRMQRICKCHGMSGSCSLRVCWRRLPPMRVVSEALGSLYDGASHVKLVERDGKPAKLRRRDPDHKKLIKSDLVYLEDSPDYCERNTELSILGTKSRLCNRTSHGIDGCRLLCCGRGYQTRIRQVEEKCKCRFVWCCTVKCEMCNHRREEHICN